jgi:peptidoglycan/LPS O-acetylase OafA/YrhL
VTATTRLAARLTRPTERRLGWNPSLDGARGGGVVIVIAFHFVGSRYLEGAPILVDMFFVLSGFLITTLLFEERASQGSISLRNFYLRRVFRLFPAVYALLAVFLVALVLFGGEQRGVLFQEFLAASLYVYNFLVAYTGVEGKVLVQLWTLSIEEQFYFVWPIVLIAALGARRRLGMTTLLVGVAALIVVPPILRMTLEPELGARTFESTVFGLAILRPDSLMLGCVAAMLWRLEPAVLSPRAQTAARVSSAIAFTMFVMTLILGGFSPFAPFVSPFYNLTVLVVPVWLVDMVRRPDSAVAKGLSHPVLLWFGKRSYGIYIWHMVLYFPIRGIVEGILVDRTRLVTIVTFPLAFAATVGVAVISWNYIETPALRVKQRFATSGR